MSENTKFVYFFGAGKSEGRSGMRTLLGGKGANLAEMAALGLPVPPGFTITTEACAKYYELGRIKFLDLVHDEVVTALRALEEATGKRFGHGPDPLLVSVRSGAAASMPGMMDTVLNLGLNEETVEALVTLTGNERFVKDSRRRFLQMYGSVVLGVQHDLFEHELEAVKKKAGVNLDTDLDIADLDEVIARFLAVVAKETSQPFPEDPMEQLWGGIEAVFASWNNPRAIKYRMLNDIRGLIGTAVNVQSMVYGNMGEASATGVAFTRDPSTGENKYFYGEYLINAQGEDVVAGIRTPQQITLDGSRAWAKSHRVTEKQRAADFPSLEEKMPALFKQLDETKNLLERHYCDMQDIEFTIENGTLYILQTRNGKRTASAAVKIATDLVAEGVIDEPTAVMRVDPNQLDQLLHPVFKKGVEASAEKAGKKILQGLNASPGAASGRVVFSAESAEAWRRRGEKVILVRTETSPEDIGGMVAAEGVLTARGGMTSHAAVVARGMGKCCVAGAGALQIDYAKKIAKIVEVKKHENITLNTVPLPLARNRFFLPVGWSSEGYSRIWAVSVEHQIRYDVLPRFVDRKPYVEFLPLASFDGTVKMDIPDVLSEEKQSVNEEKLFGLEPGKVSADIPLRYSCEASSGGIGICKEGWLTFCPVRKFGGSWNDIETIGVDKPLNVPENAYGAKRPWRGPEVFSAQIRFAWTGTEFMFQANVRDEIHFQPNTGHYVYNADCLQLAVDPMLRRQDLPGNIYVFNLSLTPKGPELYRWLGPRLEATADFVPPPDDVSMGDRYLKIEQRDNGLLYDLRLPWSELAPVKPDCNTRLGIYLIFMNNNGHGLLDTLHWPVPVPGMWTVPKKWGVLSLMS